MVKQHQTELDPPYTHYAKPTVATSQKKHPKQQVCQKPVATSQLTAHHGIEKNSRLPHYAHACGHNLSASQQWSSERTCVSDNEHDGGTSREYFPGRRSYSDDELSLYQSPRKCGFCRRHCPGIQFLSHSSDSSSSMSPAQSRDNFQHQEHTQFPQPRHHGCCVCNSPAPLR